MAKWNQAAFYTDVDQEQRTPASVPTKIIFGFTLDQSITNF